MWREEVSFKAGVKQKLCDRLERKVLKWCSTAEREIEIRLTKTVYLEKKVKRKKRFFIELVVLTMSAYIGANT